MLSNIKSGNVQRYYSMFAELFEYPVDGYTEMVNRLSEQMRDNSLVNEELSYFAKYVDGQSLQDLQSKYTSTFDINPPLPIYVGYYLFGESYMRSVFLMELNSRFNKYEYSWSNELSDHISVILRFVDTHRDSELADELINDALIPMLDRISWKNIQPEDQYEHKYPGYAYYKLLNALRIYLLQEEGLLDEYNLEILTEPISFDVLDHEDGDIDAWIKGGNK